MKNNLAIFLVLFSFVLFGQTENFWSKKVDFPSWKRERAVGFSIGNFGYMCAGVDTAETVLKDLWKYDPVLDSWSQMADLPGSKRRDAIGFTIDGIGYVGTGIDNDESFSGVKLNDFWAYNPILNTWTQKANFPGDGGLGIYFATAFEMSSKGYVCGGKSGPNNYSNELWEYKPLANTWSIRANFPGGVRYQMSSFSIGYKAYVGAGANQDTYKKDFWEYNGGNNQWTQKANLPASERGSASSFSIGLRGFVCLGTNGGLLDDLWEFNPFSNAWAIRAPFGGSERKNAMAFVLNNKAYVGTGKGYSGKKGSVYEYTPLNNVFLETKDLENAGFEVYPNPADGQITVKFENSLASQLTIYTLQGKIMLQTRTNAFVKLEVNTSELNAGCYLIVVKDDFGNSIGKKKILVI